MFTLPFAEWFCCLNPREACLVLSFDALRAPGIWYIPRGAANTAAAACGAPNGSTYLLRWRMCYRVTPGTAVVEGVTINVYNLEPTIWGQIRTERDAGDFACAEPCFITSGPWAT